jgi:hypothetical protein
MNKFQVDRMNVTSKDVTKFEFLLTLEKNIVVQRYFNVLGYNFNTKNSIEMLNTVEDICKKIEHFLKIKTLEYLSDNQGYFPNNELLDDENIDKKEHFKIEIKMGDDVFIQRIFPAYTFPPKVRYTVDIRPMLRGILGELTEVLSINEVENKYLHYNLN